ncbi:SatD family protein [Oryzobacter telluris]|uniref:SatD family protein n=1 Tax=Oryzobacter telluris TaxID=3149179 RepID=UPI00370D555F
MARMKDQTSRVVLIGDVVDSRGAANRRALHRAVEKALVGVNAVVPALGELRVTVGDEFQGSYGTLGAALDAALRVRLELLPRIDTRFGIGRGAVTMLDAARGIEDGPGWWSAREAIEAAEDTAGRSPTRTVRTAVRAAADDPSLDAVNAALVCRDHLVGSLSERSLRLLRGLMNPHTTQSELATLEGISASAVSQRVRADGIGAVLAAHELLRALP